jgi:large subunit ribosomal protein L25
MAQNTLNVLKRVRMGKSGAREIRREGNVPAILYGKGADPIPLVINPADLKQALSTEAGENTLLEINVQNDSEEIKKLSLLRDIQYDFLTSKPIHFDFQALDIDKKITVGVPVVITGVSKGVKEGGILEEILRDISVECLPKDIPNSYEVDVSELEIGNSIHIGALEIADEINLLHDEDETIVTVLAPRMEVVEEVEEEEEGEEVEGEEVEGEEGAEAKDDSGEE